MRGVPANGIVLCAETFGEPGDPAILLLHGAGNTMLSWDEAFCERLAAGGRQVVRYDLRNSGRSLTATPGFTYGDLVEDCAGLLDALGIGRAHLVGVSLGGGVAQLMAVEHPDRVSALTLVASTPGGPGHPAPDLPGMSDELRAFFAEEPPAPDWDDREAIVEYLVEAHRPFSPCFDEAAMRAQSVRVVDHSADIGWSLTAASMEVGDPWRHRLGEIAAPTLVAHGAEDPMFPYAHARALAREIPGATLLPLERTGHEYFPPHTWDRVVPAILAL